MPISGVTNRDTIRQGAVHEIFFDERECIGHSNNLYAPSRLLSDSEKATLIKQLRESDPKGWAAIQEALDEAEPHDEITRRNPLLTEQDADGNIHAVATIVVALDDADRIKGAMASRRVSDGTKHKKSGKTYFGSPARDELKRALFVGTSRIFMIDAAVLLNTRVAWVEADAIETLKDGLGCRIAPQSREAPRLRRMEAGQTVAGASLTRPRERQRGREKAMHAEECKGKTDEARERKANASFGSAEMSAAQEHAFHNHSEKQKARKFGGDEVSEFQLLSAEARARGHKAANLLRSHLDQGGSPTFECDGYTMQIRDDPFRVVEHAPLNKNGEYLFRQGQCKGDFKIHVDEVDSDGEPLDEPRDVDDSDYDSDDDDSVWLCFDVAAELKLLKPHFEHQREIADMTRPSLKRALKEDKLSIAGNVPELKKRLYLHRTGKRITEVKF
ncbi:hypothetical protein SO694_00037279 [Aureococcus anophagefferens]|uniref:Uncharacterized protein n=2 Tax=Aureococcus anophagefferens TaxID=44056 RepID=F0XXD0_AURAN|nr:hypothetical protein AURANDRAFT_61186 [Aureococcus anophagefferens]EGB12368.1 hypothetical protein AURANDRAFT_61186 [Aureococcus anophagefferens]|eukprot:XP_009033407.1 hypothetical protein AURANDRAFT_61186 [Aureococcus anophagefferens]